MVLVTPSLWLADGGEADCTTITTTTAAMGNTGIGTGTGTGALWPGNENAIRVPDSVHASFTPMQLKYQPRAWQRKPTTPAATGDSQHPSRKIWKRVPLQNIVSNVNAAWEKGGEAGDGIMRPVKKMRVASTTATAAIIHHSNSNSHGHNDDKENAVMGITAKWDREPSPLKSPRRGQPQTWMNVQGTDANTIASHCSDLTCNLDHSNVTSRALAPQPSPPPSSPLPAVEPSLPGAEDASNIAIATAAPAESTPVPVDLSHTAESDQPTKAVAEEALFDLSPPEEIQSETVTPTPSTAHTDQTTQPSNHSDLQDQDDTAYLQAFLSRSRAQRDANPQLTAVSNSVPSNNALGTSNLPDVPSRPGPTEQSVIKQTATSSEARHLPPATKSADPSQGKLVTADSKPPSPCRRSTRLIRLPRPPRLATLPNTICLRRLNGTEFVAMQKEARSLATATRANTKRNKGGALNVHERLIQLHAEEHEPVDEERQKIGKGVAWAETIARMQAPGGQEVPYEPDPTPEPEIDGDLLDKSEHDEQDETKTEPETDLTPIRERRRENLGNGLGTPQPKVAIELVFSVGGHEPEEHDEPEELEGHHEIEIPKPTPIKKKRTRTTKA